MNTKRDSFLLLRVATLGCIALSTQFIFAATTAVPRFSVHEVTLEATGTYANPYAELSADAMLTEPDGQTPRTMPLFWDGGRSWKFRFAPDKTGSWKWTIKSADAGLDGKMGNFDCVASNRKGSIRPMTGFPHHFERQDGFRFWFMGDTAWALYLDHAEEKHNREAAHAYIDARASQGFTVLHSALLSEAGWGNQGGPPWHEIGAEKINPDYWREVDLRLGYANSQGIVCGLALAWGDKRKVEPYAWRKFPSLEARKRYARYIAARYSAHDVYFIVAGEWHAEIRTRDGATEAGIRAEFIEIGDTLRAADPHGRMIAIHPMTAHGSVREFNEPTPLPLSGKAGGSWMSFGDYQQNYRDLHPRILESRRFSKPVVNSEYGYFLRDQSGDGIPDKDNSTSLEAMRHATWDIVMAGGYAVTGFGTTYFGGNRDPGPFDLTAEKNKPWEGQMGYMKQFFASLDWWKLEPHDELLRCATPRGQDTRELKQIAPPKITYWCLAEPGKQYVIYGRGLTQAVELSLEREIKNLRSRQWNPRTGVSTRLNLAVKAARLEFRPHDDQDWAVIVE